MICAGLLFGIKGSMDAMTTLPDSSGWKVCDGRLNDEGMQWLSEEHALWEFFILDYWWFWRHHSLLRYCSDMMFSGHTFVVTLFALGCYEQLRIVLEADRDYKAPRRAPPRRKKALALAALSALAIG